MKEIKSIVLTGGPCAGKSTALEYLRNELEKCGVTVMTFSECATQMMNKGMTPDEMGSYEFHSLLFENQYNAEEALRKRAEAINDSLIVLLFDRGLLDNRAYVTAEDFNRYSGRFELNEEKIRNRYDAVFHLVSAANGAEEHYHFDNNEVRSETIEKARELDEEVLSLYTGTTHLRIIDNSTDFEGKLSRLLDEVKSFLGIPEPLEIERKFLIEMPDLLYLNSMKTCRKVPITQAYLDTEEEGRFRIRKRGEGENAIYVKTSKYKINELIRIEIENYISKEEFYNYLFDKNSVVGIISKDRYCIAWHSTYYELDVYPFWDNQATLEIELQREEQPYELPDFVKLIREVSFEKEFRNKALAVRQMKNLGFGDLR